jgi:hypothetical protein
MRTGFLFLAPFFIAAVGLLDPSASANEATAIKLQGTLLSLEFLGPPNYGENHRSDRRERALVLQLPASARTQGVHCEIGAVPELCAELTDATLV